MAKVSFSLEGKVALVTGASYGIGFAIATAYAKAGAKIVFNDIKSELVETGLKHYRELGIDATGYVVDVTDEEQVREMVEKIEREVGIIDILVNNAGIIDRTPMLEMTAQQWRKVVDIATPQTAPLREKQPDGSRHPFDKFIIAKTPAARWGTPEDLQGPALFLASDASNFVNGHVLYVDGGILAYIGKQP